MVALLGWFGGTLLSSCVPSASRTVTLTVQTPGTHFFPYISVFLPLLASHYVAQGASASLVLGLHMRNTSSDQFSRPHNPL